MNLPGWLRDPVTTKELSGSARHWQTFAFRGVYIAMIGAVLWSYSADFRVGRVWFSPSAAAGIGRNLFQSFVLLQALLVILASISAASDLVTMEVRRGTLGLLVCTPLKPWSVAFGKWRACITQAGTLLLCGVPVLSSCAFLGGATPDQIACATLVTFAAGALAAALSLFFSSVFRTGTMALLATSLLMAAYILVPMLLDDGGSSGTAAFAVLSHLHLVHALAAGAFLNSRLTLIDLHEAWMSACVVSVALSLFLIRLTAGRIATLTVRTPAPPVLNRTFDAMDRFFEGLGPEKIRSLRFFEGRSGVWQDNAVYWKELNTRASGRFRNSVRISLVLILLLALAFNLDRRYLPLPIWITSVLLWLLGLANGASLFVREKEERKWDILLATPLSSSQILTAKLVAGFVPLLPMGLTILFFWTLLGLTGSIRGDFLLIALISIAFPCVLAYLVAALCSLLARSLRAAFTSALSAMLGLVIGLPWLLSEFRFDRMLERSTISPIRFLSYVSQRILVFGGWWYSGNPGDDFAGFLLLYVVVSGAVLTVLYQGFNSITGRKE